MSELIPAATVAHLGLYRDPKTLAAIEYFFKPPANFSKFEVIIVDPMLATGHSAAAAIGRIKEFSVRGIKLDLPARRAGGRCPDASQTSRRAGLYRFG